MSMKHFKDALDQVWAFPADGSEDHYIDPELIPISDAEADALRQPPPLSVEQRIEALRVGVQEHLDAKARALGYDDIRTAVTYAEEPSVPKFQAEGQAMRAWRSLVWSKCYEVLAQWKAGEIAEPTQAELLALLPVSPL